MLERVAQLPRHLPLARLRRFQRYPIRVHVLLVERCLRISGQPGDKVRLLRDARPRADRWIAGVGGVDVPILARHAAYTLGVDRADSGAIHRLPFDSVDERQNFVLASVRVEEERFPLRAPRIGARVRSREFRRALLDRGPWQRWYPWRGRVGSRARWPRFRRFQASLYDSHVYNSCEEFDSYSKRIFFFFCENYFQVNRLLFYLKVSFFRSFKNFSRRRIVKKKKGRNIHSILNSKRWNCC